MEDYIPGTKIKIFWFTEEELYGCLPEGFVFYGEKPLYHQLLSIVFSLQFDDGSGLFHDMGTGKSYTAINIARAKGIQDKILVISVNASLENWKNEFKLYAGGEYKVQVVSGSRDDKEELLTKDADVYIINYEGTFIRKKLERDIFGRKKRREFQFDEMILNGLDRDWNYLILDECFIKGTKVLTDKGLVNIDKIMVGDIVYSKQGIDRVKSVSCKEIPLSELILLTLTNGERFCCSSNHLFCLNNGLWTCAETLKVGDNLFIFGQGGKNEKNIWLPMRGMRGRFSSYRKRSAFLFKSLYVQMARTFASYKRTKTKKLLYWFKKMVERYKEELTRNYRRNKQENFGEDKINQSNEESTNKRENEANSFTNWAWYFRAKSWWKWKTSSRSSENFMGSFKKGLGNKGLESGISCLWLGASERFSKLLQVGYCVSRVKTWNRSKWYRTSYRKRKTKRQKENNQNRDARVASVEFYESGNFDRFKEYFNQGEINYERQTVKLYDLEIAGHPSFYIGDSNVLVHNSRACMNVQAYQTRIAMRLAFQSKFRVILSGLPIVKTLEEIFSQQFCVDLGREFSSSFGKFKKTYFQKLFLCPKCKEIQAKCICKLMGKIAYPIWVAKPEAEELVHEKMYQQGIRFSKQECLDLPEKIYVTRTLEMKGDAKSFYQKLKAEKSATVITKHNKVELTAMLMRFMQICGGWLKAEDEVKEFKDNTKLQELLYLLDGELAEEKVAIVSCFVAEQEGIYNYLIEQGIKTEKVTSKSEDDVFTIVERFNNDPTIQCLVLSHKMGSKAINVRASYMIFFSQNFDKDSNMQIEDRIHGIPGKRGIEGKSSTYIRFIIRDSVDERVEEILANNAKLISGVVEGKKLGDYL